MNYTEALMQIASYLENPVKLFFAILFALLISRIAEELEDANYFFRNRTNGFFPHLGRWLIYYATAFFITLLVIMALVFISAFILEVIS